MILISYGTRPEYLKVKPLMEEFDKNNIKYDTLFTGQHMDLIDDVVIDQVITISSGNNRLDSIVSSIMNNVDFTGVKFVLVQGDTTSAFAVALTAFHHKVKIIHLEAGLRTYDTENPYPEEFNRQAISKIADIHFCPTFENLNNLANERINKPAFVVGNTCLDNLVDLRYRREYTDTVLITLHRRENHHWIDKWFIEINKIAEEYPELRFVFPMHPNPNVRKHKDLIKAKNIEVLNPLSHNDLLEILIKSRLVITDSGGIQEESSFFNKICLTCRKITERPEAINKSTYMIKKPEDLKIAFDNFVNDYEIKYECPFGDGKSSEKIVEIIKTL